MAGRVSVIIILLNLLTMCVALQQEDQLPPAVSTRSPA
jgi:hypothetical protein